MAVMDVDVSQLARHQSGRRRPDEIGTQTFVDGTTVVRRGRTGCRVEEGVVRGRHAARVEAHEVWDDDTNPAFLVVQHDRRAARCARAQLERPVRVLIIERLAVQTVEIVDREIIVFEKHDVSGVLARHSFTYRTMTRVFVNRLAV
jgi:hypothetical protein